MRHIRLVLLAVLGIPALFLAVGFLHGAYLSLTGQQHLLPRSKPKVAQSPGEKDRSTGAVPPAVQVVPQTIPNPVDDGKQGMLAWYREQGLMLVVDGKVVVNEARVALLRVKQLAAIHQTLPEPAPGEGARLMLFALGAYLPAKERRAFASRVGAAKPIGFHWGDSVYVGDFTRLLYLVEGHADAYYARAVQRYAQVLTDEEVIAALRYIGAIRVESTTGEWSIRVKREMQRFDADTLMALHDAIDDRWMGQRSYLRRELKELAAAKRGKHPRRSD